jgi:hypothetical protein
VQAVNATSNSPAGTISGTLRKVVVGDFSYFQVEDTKGKIEKTLVDGVLSRVENPAHRSQQAPQ